MLDAGARVIHVDVMDGHFVPPITVGPLVVAALAEQAHDAGAMLEVHLMIERPERQVSEFVKAGAHSVTFHAEATPNVAYTAGLIRDSGACVGVAINPATAGRSAGGGGHMLDVALCMTVNPGWGGQPFIEHSLDKIDARARDHRLRRGARGGRRHRPRDGSALPGGGREPVRRRLGDLRAPSDPGEAYRAIAASVGAELSVPPRRPSRTRRAGAARYSAAAAAPAVPWRRRSRSPCATAVR